MAKKTALKKIVLKEIVSSKARFLSILFLILLGVSFFAGLQATGPNMLNTANEYFDDQRLMDLRIQSTLGLEEEIDILRTYQDTEVVQAGYSQDVLAGENRLVMQIFGYHEDMQLNAYVVKSGRLPEASGEIALDNRELLHDRYEIGDTITLYPDSSENDLSEQFKRDTYTVVGFVNSPIYITEDQRGNTTVGRGTLDAFGVVIEADFDLPVYTDAYLTFTDLAGVDTYSDLYQETALEHQEALEKQLVDYAPTRLRLLKEEPEETLAEAEQELAEGKTELAEAETELAEAKDKIDKGRQELAQADQDLVDAKAELADGERAYQENLTGFEAEITQAEREIAEAEATLANEQAELDEQRTQLEAGLRAIEGQEEAAAQKQELEMAMQALESGLAELDQAWATLSSQAAILAEEKATGEAQLAAVEQELAEGSAEYQAGIATLAEEKVTLAEAETSYQEGLTEFEREQETAGQEIADAETEIAEARTELADLAEPEYYLFSREDNSAFIEYADNADRLAGLATIFPGVFFAIAALVTLTTITRMIEEQRGEIGTLKALGYTNWEVSLKYYLYAIVASVMGTVFGLILGYQLFPRIIYNAYRIMYNLPDLVISSYLSYTLISIVIALTCTIVTAWVVLRVDLRSSPAVLMRPRAPKIGKRILLERMTPLWKRLNFIEKVTARNLFRYKQRMLMTVLGIAGCAALIITGFGLQGAIGGLTNLQYGDVINYDGMVIFDQDATEQDSDAYQQLMLDQSGLDDRLAIFQEQFDVRETGQNPQEVYLMVPEDEERFTDFIALNDRTSDEAYQLDGVMVTEKLAVLFGLEVGDDLALTDVNNVVTQVTISAIVENYTGHYIYLNEASYHTFFGGNSLSYNADLLIYQQDQGWEDQLSEQLIEQDKVVTTIFNSTTIATFDDSMDSLNIVVIVLIVSAAILALIVLYNLTNINVSERIRELSTIKVLGFYDREVTMYIYRENIILTLMGIGVGSVIGRLLHIFVLDTASMDNLMFNPALHGTSYLYAAILTLLFSSCVMVIMHHKLKNVDMIEALKSNE